MADKTVTAPIPLTDLYSACVVIIAFMKGIGPDKVGPPEVASFWQTIWEMFND